LKVEKVLLIDPIFDLALELCGLPNCGSQMGILSLVSAAMFDVAQDRGHYAPRKPQ
jgi:hypothetical protein